MSRLYQRYISSNHLDVGPGTGYFLDRCTFPTPRPRLALLDASPHSLAAAGRRLARCEPELLHRDLLHRDLRAADLAGGRPFDSVGLTAVLPCLPGDIGAKAVAFDRLVAAMAPSAVLFGCTVPGLEVPHSRVGRRLLARLNRRGVFCNREDRVSDLERERAARFATSQVWIEGAVALFVARRS